MGRPTRHVDCLKPAPILCRAARQPRVSRYLTPPGSATLACMAGQISDETKLDWLRLIRSDHVGPHTFRMLLSRFGGAGAALAALPDLARRGGAAGPSRIYSR